MGPKRSPSKRLIVDGFNIAHAWPHLEARFAEGIDMVVDHLTRDLRSLYDSRDWDLTIVLDGQGAKLDHVYPFVDTSFELIYSPASLTADAVIEKLVSHSTTPESILVATHDQIILDSIGAGGAHGVSPELLWDWVLAARRRCRAEEKKRDISGESTWENRIPL